MLVEGFGSPRGDIVHIDIEDLTSARARDRQKIAQPRFFFRLAKRRRQQVRLTVGVATELQPTFELSVMREKYSPTLSRNDPGRGGDVAWKTISKKTTLVVSQQHSYSIDRCDLVRMTSLVEVQQLH